MRICQARLKASQKTVISTLPCPHEEMFAVQRGRGEKFVSDNSKCIGTSKGGGGGVFSGMTHFKIK